MSNTFAYDMVDYPAHVFPQMHPSRLAAIGRLHGIAAASPLQCRLLEIGCGDGLQLITLAMAYPDAEFVGVDLSAKAIARGDAMRARLGLHNLRLVAADLLEWNPGEAAYDYITAHGFWSWVPDVVRGRLLALCEQKLAAAGIAYVSYNAMPGCHLRRMLWDMMKFHVRDVSDPSEKTRRAREFLAWLGNDLLSRKIYADAVRAEALDLLNATHPTVLFHDDLSEINDPFTITDFVARARASGLDFLAEADYHEMSDVAAPPQVRERLAMHAGGDVVRREQYLDFLQGRRFRQTLLCRRHALQSRTPDATSLQTMEVAGQLRVEGSDPEPTTRAPVQFVNQGGAALTIDLPVAKAAFALIGASFPQPLAFGALLELARTRTGSSADIADDRAALSEVLASAFEIGLVNLYCNPPRFAAAPGDRPRVSPLVELQLEAGLDLVASLRPSMARLDNGVTFELVRLLDGKRDRAAILRDLSARMSRHPIPDGGGNSLRQPEAWWRERLAPELEGGLQQVARMSLLVED
ncbi:MAG TPA: methyltransferase regulatory domain-containing protein [Thermomonas sp.]|nr:methyltransferase regulatory domain-containing protein [Thermomonas sp.]